MAQGCSDSEEEKDPQAEVEGPTSFEPVHQDPRQKSWYYYRSIESRFTVDTFIAART